MNRQTLVAFLLIALILVLMPKYYQWMGLTKPEQSTEQDTTAQPVRSAKTPFSKSPPPAQELLSPRPVPVQPALQDTIPEKIFHINTSLYLANVSSRGGGTLTSFKLKNYKRYDGKLVDLIDANLNRDNLLIHFDRLTGNSVESITLDPVFAETSQLSDHDTMNVLTPTKLTFTRTYINGSQIVKSLTFHPRSYLIDLYVDLSQVDDISQNHFTLDWPSGLPVTERSRTDDINYFAAHLYQGEKDDEVLIKHSGKADKPIGGTGKTAWAAVRSKYFTAALIGRSESNFGRITGNRHSSTSNGLDTPEYNIVIGFTSVRPAECSLYLGPLKYSIIKDLAVGLEKTMNFGLPPIRPISKGVLFLLTAMHNIIPNYGVLLVIFAVVVKVIVYPLTKRSYQSTKELQGIQPLVMELRQKFKNDPQRLNRETMKLYKEHGVNPLGGCLPMLLQMPLLFALFIVFRTTIELRAAPFVWWIKDLSAPDTVLYLPFHIPIYGSQVSLLPIFMGISMFLQQRMMGTQASGQQKYMGYLMTGFFFLIFNGFPSGLNLYYTLFNVLTILQQKYLVQSRSALPAKAPPHR